MKKEMFTSKFAAAVSSFHFIRNITRSHRGAPPKFHPTIRGQRGVSDLYTFEKLVLARIQWLLGVGGLPTKLARLVDKKFHETRIEIQLDGGVSIKIDMDQVISEVMMIIDQVKHSKNNLLIRRRGK